MKNKILAGIWMLTGAFAGICIGALLLVPVIVIVRSHVGNHSPIISIIGLILPVIGAMGAQWYQRLFYKGLLWGYKPDADKWRRSALTKKTEPYSRSDEYQKNNRAALRRAWVWQAQGAMTWRYKSQNHNSGITGGASCQLEIK